MTIQCYQCLFHLQSKWFLPRADRPLPDSVTQGKISALEAVYKEVKWEFCWEVCGQRLTRELSYAGGEAGRQCWLAGGRRTLLPPRTLQTEGGLWFPPLDSTWSGLETLQAPWFLPFKFNLVSFSHDFLLMVLLSLRYTSDLIKMHCYHRAI